VSDGAATEVHLAIVGLAMNELLIARVILSGVMIASGGALWWAARAAATGRLKRNEVAGIRTATTLASTVVGIGAARAEAER